MSGSATAVSVGAPTRDIGPLAVLDDAGLEVPVLGGRRVRHVNLDVAASAPALSAVSAHVASVLPYYSSVHRGTGYPSQASTALVDDARAVVARHVGARLDDVVVFTRNTTEALNLLAGVVPGETVVLDLEHHANLLPWERRGRRVVVASPTIAATLGALAAELRRRPAALVSVTGASNVTGEVLPVAAIAALAHEHGARLAVDAAQLLPHRRVDIAASGIDYLAFSGHKAYAPYGAGALVGRADWLDDGPAHLQGGGAVESVRVDGATWKTGAERHEAGTPNVLGIAALARALVELERLGERARRDHEDALTSQLHSGLARIAGVRVIRGFDDADDRLGIATIELERGSVGLVAAALAAEHGVSVRAGRFCAHPFFDRVASRANGLRASLGAGSSADDVERFVDALKRLVANGPSHEYDRTPAGWCPRVDDRPRPSFA
ncbi:selenocysteine lyase/cysteine desulfurase [Agromyces flavus]|uniref:Selenocysteine lyase/cysteine desulfurase n=1 Tax=Agromyces flavus TaxID=589382 RepID=A0A1H1XI21_9MICO|nr:aminotransferase class V-fold PLP-dependent enzyme [Agromyces flavus]MCP2366422.1 selenocysteine lyase/cysteine desulfurase [Agromyces flavus]GGI44646.1 putative aminotransferase/cysteine desulfurase [Agromyces flavus]SDT08915.1 Selenocysteine lyase/Cysteine desulfurase [Agromyces flavus]